MDNLQESESELVYDRLARTRNDVLLCSQEIADCFLLDVGILLVEFICESERNDGQTSVIVGTILSLEIWLLPFLVFELALLSVNVADLHDY